MVGVHVRELAVNKHEDLVFASLFEDKQKLVKRVSKLMFWQISEESKYICINTGKEWLSRYSAAKEKVVLNFLFRINKNDQKSILITCSFSLM